MASGVRPGCDLGFVMNQAAGRLMRIVGKTIALDKQEVIVAVPHSAVSSEELPLPTTTLKDVDGNDSKVSMIRIPLSDTTTELSSPGWSKAARFAADVPLKSLMKLYWGDPPPEISKVSTDEGMQTARSFAAGKQKGEQDSAQSWALFEKKDPKGFAKAMKSMARASYE